MPGQISVGDLGQNYSGGDRADGEDHSEHAPDTVIQETSARIRRTFTSATMRRPRAERTSWPWTGATSDRDRRASAAGRAGLNELQVALNRGEIRAGLIDLTQRQRVVGLVSKAGHITCLAGRARLFLAYR
jgi:hypothetical protein